MSEERPEVSDHWMILQCGVGIWNRWRKINPRYSLGDSFRGADFVGADLADAHLVGADLRGADFGGANLGRANLRNADLLNAYLVGANLRRAVLREAHFHKSDLGGANLQNADLRRADFGRAGLQGADLRGADCQSANLRGADLQDADLEHAGLQGADFGGADLRGASLEGAFVSHTHFHAVDLRSVKGLEAVHHRGPSTVSSQTLKKSQGHVSEVFLRGCGLEDWEMLATKLHDPNLRPDQVTDIGYQVVNMRGTSPIVPLSVFISYSHENVPFIEKLEAWFDKDGIRYWRDVHDLKAGPIEAQVDRAIGLQRATLLVLSEDSVESDWVESEAHRAREVEKARRKGGEGRYVLCPIALDDAWKTCDWPRRLREQIMEYNILDFSRWGSDEEFEKEYEKLKDGLGIYYVTDVPGAEGAS